MPVTNHAQENLLVSYLQSKYLQVVVDFVMLFAGQVGKILLHKNDIEIHTRNEGRRKTD